MVVGSLPSAQEQESNQADHQFSAVVFNNELNSIEFSASFP